MFVGQHLTEIQGLKSRMVHPEQMNLKASIHTGILDFFIIIKFNFQGKINSVKLWSSTFSGYSANCEEL